MAIKSGQLVWSQFRVPRAVCAGAPSCWKMYPLGNSHVAEPVASTRWQIFSTVLSFQFFRGIRPLSPLLHNLAHATSAFSFCRLMTPYPYHFSLKTCFLQKLSKFINRISRISGSPVPFLLSTSSYQPNVQLLNI